MRKFSWIAVFAGSILAAPATAGTTYIPSLVAVNDALIGTPSFVSANDMSSTSKANKHGANKRAFCPPGQAKKPGRGSNFRC